MRRTLSGRKTNISRYITLSIFALFFILPIIYTITNSFMSVSEITRYYADGDKMVLHIFPDKVSFDGYYQLLFRRPDYLIKFWNSLMLTGVIVVGQVVISSLAGYAFSKFHFPGRDAIFFVIIIIMMMPYQVTLVANYIVLDKMGLIGGYLAVILPAVFSPFGVFLMRQVISTMPDELIEAAKLDGASQVQLLFKIVVPRNKGGIVSLIILSFVDNWNMVEQPLVFLDDKYKYPLSIFLSQINQTEPGLSFACGVLAMIPVILLFVFFEKELIDGIGFANLK